MTGSGLNKSGTEPDNIDALLGKPKTSKPKTITKAIMLTKEDIEQVNYVAKMLGTTNFSEGLRHCIHRYWDDYGDEILRICKERDAIKLP